ncbi:unnamed protein product, partial [Tetraodon nigroviridis]
ISLEGFFPKPGADYSSTSTSGPDRTFTFVNNRPVHHKDIMKVQISASAQLDVNLTPDKTQVLLHDKEAVLTALEALLVSLYWLSAY